MVELFTNWGFQFFLTVWIFMLACGISELGPKTCKCECCCKQEKKND